MIDQKYLDKAEILIEALPYIQRFNRKIVVVKYGGSAMVDHELKKNVIEDVVSSNWSASNRSSSTAAAKRSAAGWAKSAWNPIS